MCGPRSHSSNDRVSFMTPGLLNLCMEKHLEAMRTPPPKAPQSPDIEVSDRLPDRDL